MSYELIVVKRSQLNKDKFNGKHLFGRKYNLLAMRIARNFHFNIK